MTSGNDEELVTLLRDVLEEFDCTSGTLHRAEGGELTLVAHEGIPDPVLTRIETIPIGKGMAGLAAERRGTVQVCNLQTDDSDVAEPGARETMMKGALRRRLLGRTARSKGPSGSENRNHTSSRLPNATG